jgi:hypothetical protein
MRGRRGELLNSALGDISFLSSYSIVWTNNVGRDQAADVDVPLRDHAIERCLPCEFR